MTQVTYNAPQTDGGVQSVGVEGGGGGGCAEDGSKGGEKSWDVHGGQKGKIIVLITFSLDV